jgi:aminoacyl-tRNA hydrolase
MQPVERDGVTFIRDDFKAPLWSMDLSLEFMKNAQAKRKILVIGTLCELGSKKSSQIYARLARRACEIADIAIFAGPWAFNALKARRPGEEDKLLAFSHVRDAANFVNSITTTGDLVLLKGTNTLDHLVRIIMARSNDIACWRDDCKRLAFCDACPDRARQRGPAAIPVEVPAPSTTSPAAPASEPDPAQEEAFIVGLGNPGAEFAGTPHNVGYDAVDSIAKSLGLAWEQQEGAWMARGMSNGRAFRLVKLQAQMNHTGAALKQLAEAESFEARQCVLLFDDLDVPIGSMRSRLNGGAAGHKGLASILDAFQTNELRRVKIGVGHPDAKLNRVEYVLKPFDAATRPSVDEGVVAAGVRALEMATGGGTFGTPGTAKPKKVKEPSPTDAL